MFAGTIGSHRKSATGNNLSRFSAIDPYKKLIKDQQIQNKYLRIRNTVHS
jgi:hypothetical protein